MYGLMKRVCYLGIGHICVVLAIIGAILPGMPTTVFLIIAAWAYGKSSERFQRMVLDHPRYGAMVRNWQEHGVIPQKAKILAGLSMAISASFCFYKAHSWVWPSITAACMLVVYMYILSRPSQRVPAAIPGSLESDPR